MDLLIPALLHDAACTSQTCDRLPLRLAFWSEHQLAPSPPKIQLRPSHSLPCASLPPASAISYGYGTPWNVPLLSLKRKAQWSQSSEDDHPTHDVDAGEPPQREAQRLSEMGEMSCLPLTALWPYSCFMTKM